MHFCMLNCSGVAGGERVPPLTAKKLPKVRKKREERGKIREEKAKIGKFLSLCPSWQIGLAMLLLVFEHDEARQRWLWVEIVCHSPWNGTLCPLMEKKKISKAYMKKMHMWEIFCAWTVTVLDILFSAFSVLCTGMFIPFEFFKLEFARWYFKNLFVGNIWKRYKQRGLLLLSLFLYHQWQCLCYVQTWTGGTHVSVLYTCMTRGFQDIP